MRDDDNLLAGRVEAQFVRAVNAAADRLRSAGRPEGPVVADEETARRLSDGLRHEDQVTHGRRPSTASARLAPDAPSAARRMPLSMPLKTK